MRGNQAVYKEAFERARSGKTRSLWQRIVFSFQDHYTQQSREQGERDGALARTAESGEAPAGATVSGA
ncbi:hypothetical protein [Longimicrobium sp.]|uniref:hypothetical protein n=1 Tax=Longimicrobium sp. TaxID=2029185 RepID=UPI002E373F7D|nr:hypothetical protein [Longimicrobium sp.]HEX6040784.1 hypothetical protein [Longimicrobium sp.]